jgi:hypothetical protein
MGTSLMSLLVQLSSLVEGHPWISSGLGVIFGAIITATATALQGRIRILTYKVNHEHVALSSDDANFGSVKATWQDHPVVNLYVSTLTLENTSAKDFQNLEFCIYAPNETILLGQYTCLVGKPCAIKFTDAFQKRIEVPPNSQPTQLQWDLYNHRREYVIPVFNRGQKAEIRFLTTVPKGGPPHLWLDITHPGLDAKLLPNDLVWGVPRKMSVSVGAGVCIFVYFTSCILFNSWAAAAMCLFAGLFGQPLGAVSWKIFRFLFRLFFK